MCTGALCLALHFLLRNRRGSAGQLSPEKQATVGFPSRGEVTLCLYVLAFLFLPDR